MTISASHGRYYDVKRGQWAWERPPLYCTTEDLLTQTFTVSFIMPMLERAGAVTYAPKERCWMKEEVIVDNDNPSKEGTYAEINGNMEWQNAGVGFAKLRNIYKDKQNPHKEGTARFVDAQNSRRMTSTVLWTPQLPKDGDYAVYVSYPVLPTNVPDAEYVIHHKGISTHVKVNQQMGGGTWVYLGTFDFSSGKPSDNYVSLSNISSYRGTITADAVRFGGGMGNVARCDTLGRHPSVSGLPRYLEAARYSALWYGLPYDIYSTYKGTHDYNDDIVTRPAATNYMARGSVYLPGDSGLCVPIELSLALHSDAGYRKDMSMVGSLGIYTSEFEDGLLPSGVSRKASGLLSGLMLKNCKRDLSDLLGNWEIRTNMDKNYGESRVPRIPGIIFEMFSHQNLSEIALAHDPTFKFYMSRAIYKSILQFCSTMHGDTPYCVQPLPVNTLAVEAEPENHRFRLSWQPTLDKLEPSATPTSYILYTAKGDGGWNNGEVVHECQAFVTAEPGKLYRFKVEALNDGGASMPSEELCGMISRENTAPMVLIANTFTRLAGPQPFDTPTERGLNVKADPGVPYHSTPEYCGPQRYFNKDGYDSEQSDGLGYSSQEWVGILQKGNTFDYPTLHARDISEGGAYHISSCSRSTLTPSFVARHPYRILDIIVGAQRCDGYSQEAKPVYTREIMKTIETATQSGTSVLMSGAYVGIDVQQHDNATTSQNRNFTRSILHWDASGEQRADSILAVKGMNTKGTLTMVPNERHLSTPRTSILQAEGTANPILTYGTTSSPAAIAYKGASYNAITLGFPIEQLEEPNIRRQMMNAFMKFLLEK
ncbi:MAG: xanthan lyase [Bacteroidales bacterium]|nr:xanthan lyase [Bacteroidales bacterium]